MRKSTGVPGLGVAIAALLVLGCGETEPTSPPPPPAPVASVVLDRDTATVAVGKTVQLTATLKDAQGAALAGRTLTWSSSSAASVSVSSTGLVTGVQVGQSRIVASAEGKSDTATVFVPAAPVAIILEQTGARTVILGPAGGSIQTIDADGVQYTLVVPPLALMSPVAITMTPLLSVTGLPLSGGFVAGADFAPSGLVFAKPATLTISTSGQAGPSQRLVGLSYRGAGSGIRLTAAEATPNAVTFVLNHFSGVIAGFGTTQDIEALYLSLPTLPGIGIDAIDLLVVESNRAPRDGAHELLLMELWFDMIILPDLGAVTTDAQLVKAMGDYQMWRRFVPDLLDIYLFVPGGENAPSLVTRRAQWDQAFTTKVTLAIARNKQLCAAPGLASARVAALDNALFWSRVVRSGVGLAPTAQNGLDLASFQAGLCAQAVIQSVVLVDPLQEGVAQSLDATFAIRFADGVTVPSDFMVTASAQGADLQFPAATASSPAGFYTGTVMPTGPGTVTLDLKACYAGGQFLLFVVNADEICQTTQLIRNVNSQLTIVSSTLPGGTVGVSYSQTLQASGGTGSYVWSVSSGQLPPGVALAPGGIISGTPTTSGSFTFTVQVVSGIQNAQRALSITVGGAVLTIDTSVLPSGAIGTSYSQTLQASGGSGSYQWSVAGGQLPPGLSLSTGGTISGSPTTGGTFSFTLAVASGAQNAQRALSITIGSLGTIIGAYDGTETVTFTPGGSQFFSGAGRWWLLQAGSLRVLVRGLVGSSAVPPLQTFVPPFVVPANGVFGASQNGVPTLSGTVGNGQLQFTWDALCNLMPPSFSTLGSCRLTFTGVLNPNP